MRLNRWRLSLKVLPLATLAVALKYVAHQAGWEAISLNPLFSGLLAATVFLLGFLVSGVLADYKESEKLPGEMAVALEALAEEAALIHQARKAEPARVCLLSARELALFVREWFFGRIPTPELLGKVTAMGEKIQALEPFSQPPFILRLKQEQALIRRIIVRINSIRETSFIGSGYAIAEAISTLLIGAFVLARIEPFYESLLFVGIIAFLFIYMLAMIRDLDDPFEYSEGRGGADEVSLKPLDDVLERIGKRIAAVLKE